MFQLATVLENDGRFCTYDFIFLQLDKNKVNPFKLSCKINHKWVPDDGTLN